MLVFDDRNLETVARMVIKLNPHAAGFVPADMVAKMRGVAYAELKAARGGYVATGGFMLTAFVPRYAVPGDVHIRASVADHCFSV